MNKQLYEINGVSLYDVRNSYESKVIAIMRELIEAYDAFDGCSICLQDVYALSMSKIKPKYVQAGTIVLRKEDSEQVLKKAVKFSIEKVIEKPNHS